MAPSLLEKCPTEVLNIVFSNITVKADLSALCLVSRRLSVVATPHLYRNLELQRFNSANGNWAGVTDFLSSSGISNIRTLKLGIGVDLGYDLCRPLNGLISLITPNSLYRFEYDSLHLPSCQELVCLWKTQKCLTNLQLDFTLSPKNNVLKTRIGTAGVTAARNITTPSSVNHALRFDATRSQAAAVEQFLRPEYALYDGRSLWVAVEENSHYLRALADVRELQVSFSFGLHSVCEVERMLRMLLNNRLEKIIYSAGFVPSFRTLLQPQALRQLAFHYTNFESTPGPSETFPSLTHLELVECSFIGQLLKWLGLSNLVSLTYQHHHRGAQYPDDDHVRPLLSRIRFFSGLKHFILDCRTCIHNYPSTLVAAIKAHKSSLESLLINSGECPSWTEPSLMCAISECKHLKQLSIPLESRTLFRDYRALRVNLPDLVVLHIFRITDRTLVMPNKILEFPFKIAQRYPAIAAEMLSNPPLSAPLSLLALGSRVKQSPRFSQSSDMKIYKPLPIDAGLASSMDANVPMAAPVELSRIREIEPHSDLLEFRLENNAS